MGRPRLYYATATYHICIRGNNRQAVLGSKEDKEQFLYSLGKFRERFRFRLYGFVLMDNHAHMVIQTNGTADISRIMQGITLSYSQKFRHRYHYTGYVWQGRFKSKVIEGDKYILECLEYVHNSPVRANMVTHPQDYAWSSYHFYNCTPSPVAEFIEIDRFTSA